MDTITSDRHEHNSGSAIRLVSQHLADLRKSGLTDAQIAACGFYSETDPHKVVELLSNYLSPKSAAKLGACLVIPYFAPDGTPTGFNRLKPDKPRKDKKKDNRLVKYEGPAGVPNRAYFPPGTRPALADRRCRYS